MQAENHSGKRRRVVGLYSERVDSGGEQVGNVVVEQLAPFCSPPQLASVEIERKLVINCHQQAGVRDWTFCGNLKGSPQEAVLPVKSPGRPYPGSKAVGRIIIRIGCLGVETTSGRNS